jgi:hypothetical protein
MDLDHTPEMAEEIVSPFSFEASEQSESQEPEAQTAETEAEDITLTDSEQQALEALRLQEQQELMIAQNPHLRQQYEAQRYGQAPQQQAYPTPQPQQPPAIDPMGQALPFNPEDFDPFNPMHQAALVQAQVAQAINPLLGYVQKLEQQEHQSTLQQQIEQADHYLNTTLDKALPGFTDALQNESSYKMRSFKTLAGEMFMNASRGYSQASLFNPVVQKAIAAKMVPELKQAAQELGIQLGKKSSGSKVASQAAYVEPFGAVPSDNDKSKSLDDAINSGNSRKAIEMLFFS